MQYIEEGMSEDREPEGWGVGDGDEEYFDFPYSNAFGYGCGGGDEQGNGVGYLGDFGIASTGDGSDPYWRN
jgi:hypothetical protein